MLNQSLPIFLLHSDTPLFLHLPSLSSTSIWSARYPHLLPLHSALPNYLCSALLWLLSSCSAMLVPIYTSWLDWLNLAHLAHLIFVCCSSRSYGPSNLSQSHLPLGNISPYPSLYYNIEVINDLNKEFIFIIVVRMQSLTRNVAEILVLNSDTGLHFCPGCAEKYPSLFLNSLKIKSSSNQTWENHHVTQ